MSRFSAKESKKIIDLLCEKYKLSAAIVNKTYARTGFCPVEESAQQIASMFDVGAAIDVEYFAGKTANLHYNSVGVSMCNDGYIDDFLSAEALSLGEAYQALVHMICDGAKLVIGDEDDVSQQVICELPPFSSYEELALKLAAKGED